jgi:DNA repair exonuclease SbcCD ATPase subunit
MLIKSATFKNFKSFGNLPQKIEFNTEKGELILLSGRNGSGKSSIISGIDYTLFKKVKGRHKKTNTLSTLPNRINGELLNEIEFVSDGTEVIVKRGQNPSVLELWENGIKNDRAGKGNIDKKIEKYVGMDFETFKSFISMSITDFKNFINLSNEEKKLLLDKLFNLETINQLNDILKELVKNNKQELAILDKEIETLNESVGSFKRSLEKSKVKANLNHEADITRIKNEITDAKNPYIKLKEKLVLIDKKETEIKTKLETNKSELITLNGELSRCLKDISLYENDQCPTCLSSLSTDFHTSFKYDLEEKKTKMESLKFELTKRLGKLNDSKNKLSIIKNDTTTSFNDMKYNLKNLKTQLQQLQDENNEEKDDLQEFINSINELEDKKYVSKESKVVCDDKKLYHKQLSDVFSEKGVKRSIIRNIIGPINNFISKNMEYMHMPFEVVLNEQFNATITQLGQEIDPETLSTGESKKINFVILLSYLTLIRTKKSINVLFLDEVFASVDVESINDILNLLRNFANEYNINIFVVHHSLLDSEHFDRIINVKKDIFTSIEEIKE